MKITKQTIDSINKVYDELDLLAKEVSDSLKEAKLNGHIEMDITRNGKDIKIRENDAWDEIRLLGDKSEIYPIMAGKYPNVFASSKKHLAKVKEIDEFVQKELGIRFDKISVRDILNIVCAVIEK